MRLTMLLHNDVLGGFERRREGGGGVKLGPLFDVRRVRSCPFCTARVKCWLAAHIKAH